MRPPPPHLEKQAKFVMAWVWRIGVDESGEVPPPLWKPVEIPDARTCADYEDIPYGDWTVRINCFAVQGKNPRATAWCRRVVYGTAVVWSTSRDTLPQ